MVETFSNLPGNGFCGLEEVLVPECIHEVTGNWLWRIADGEWWNEIRKE
jgi:hypothetical protein